MLGGMSPLEAFLAVIAAIASLDRMYSWWQFTKRLTACEEDRKQLWNELLKVQRSQGVSPS